MIRGPVIDIELHLPPDQQRTAPRAGRPTGHWRRGALIAAALLAAAGCSADTKSLSSPTSDVGSSSPTAVAATTSTTNPATQPPTVTLATAPATTAPATTAPGTTTPATITLDTAATTTLATVAPETVPPETVPPDNLPPATDPPSGGCNSCRPDYVFPYSSFFEVPQLGTEPVRGTGCGANGSLGDTIPDGIWDGHITISAGALHIDVQCVYYGASAAPFIAQCEQTNSVDDCLEYGDQFWIVNNSTRQRTVPLDPSFRRRYAANGANSCGDPGPGRGASTEVGADAMDSWVVIEHGAATFALTSCVYG